MGVNQASFFLFPPRFGPSVRLDSSATHFSGQPLRIVDAALVDPDAPPVCTSALRHWLELHGFSECERYGGIAVLYRGKQKTCLGVQSEIELSVPLEEEEISDLYIRFLLTEKTPAQWDDWEWLIITLGDAFGFKILGSDIYLLPCVDFFTLLTNNDNFRSFQEHHHWNVDRVT